MDDASVCVGFRPGVETLSVRRVNLHVPTAHARVRHVHSLGLRLICWRTLKIQAADLTLVAEANSALRLVTIFNPEDFVVQQFVHSTQPLTHVARVTLANQILDRCALLRHTIAIDSWATVSVCLYAVQGHV